MNKNLTMFLFLGLTTQVIEAQVTQEDMLQLANKGSVGACPVGMLEVEIESYDFESGEQGWVHMPLIGVFDVWSINSTTSQPHSGTKSWHARDPSAVADQVLISPTITLPTILNGLTLQFWNRQEIENDDNNPDVCFDGAILEVSTDGGTFFQIPNEKLLTDQYDGLVPTSHNNPLGSLNAWCGDPGEYINSVVDIDDLAGEDVIFRFRLASDTSEGRPGWDIDDVKIIGCEVFVDEIFVNTFE